uniref:Uncharacterized protein n=1 Tax=Compsopogon caeruleus TaxID=31354 RepID=A0A7S1XCH0_9RHOD|mmetsp:Transcript_14380/g.29440  ORF Transcript_14380/g.29440 Transcript_14380/m.29440 type:complete len:100 (+) Transcript_14380:79-378(+)
MEWEDVGGVNEAATRSMDDNGQGGKVSLTRGFGSTYQKIGSAGRFWGGQDRGGTQDFIRVQKKIWIPLVFLESSPLSKSDFAMSISKAYKACRIAFNLV